MHRRTKIWLLLLTLAVLLLTAGVFWWLTPAGPRVQGRMPASAYVWQRRWADPLKQAVQSHGGAFDELIVLGAVVEPPSNFPARVPLHWPSLLQAARPIGVAVRVESYGGPTGSEGPVLKLLQSAVTRLLDDTRQAGVTPAELQVDFDCPRSRLSIYRQWLTSLRPLLGGTKLTITTLPSWLGTTQFASLVEAVDGYVLQVHWLDKPKSFEEEMTICDPASARRWVERAGRLGVPFRVALPTYGYEVAFDNATGKFIGLAAEDTGDHWPADARRRFVRSDPIEIASLVEEWSADRPAAMTGVIFYRLPTSADRLNWPWETLQSVMEGRNF